ncbi:MAG: CBS domain-containing protein [Gammaproteobacteria bacterium]|nr:CBS domain-containing protein [Gammaproteobacteria bacterium]
MGTENDRQRNSAAELRPDNLLDTETFRGVSASALEALLARARLHRLRPGDAVFRAGQPYCECVYLVYRGEIELRRPEGDVYTVGPGQFLGLANYLDGSPYASSAQARTDVLVLELPETALDELERQRSEIFDLLNRILAQRIRERSPARRTISGALSRPVRSAMKAPVSTCLPEISLAEAFSLMQSRKIGSLAVVDHEQRLLGMLTCPGLSEAILIRGAAPDEPVIQAACETPLTVEPDTPLWQAEELQHGRGVKYLLVMEGGQPIGILSQTDILRALVTQQTTLLTQARLAETPDQLAALFQRMGEIAQTIQESNRRASQAVRIVSEAHLALQRRCVELTLEALRREGHGEPPVAFAVMVMGSGGRREMLLDPDQDNGVILADAPEAHSAGTREWFERFATRLNGALAALGYPLCPGEIMARNPRFRKPLAEWCDQISYMVRHPNQKAARWSNIVFDFDTLYGDDELTVALRKHVLRSFRTAEKLLGFMVEDDAEGRPPLGLFNRLITAGDPERRGKIDIKRNGLRIIADSARIYALHHGVSATGTVDRLNALVRLGALSGDLVDSVSAAYEELLDLALAHQIGQWGAGAELDKLVDPERLSPYLRETLRASMRAVKRFQDQLQGQFGLSPF